ncbi:reverse transcriptase domain-containing protein [Tanacetum coccineum]
MRTRSQSRRRRQQQTPPVVVENFDLEEPIVDQNIVAMADNRTMAQMLQAPIEGYEDAIVVPPINANNFELKQPLINLVQSNKFTGRQDPHNHLRFFNKVTSTTRPPRSILTWDDLVSKFINQFFPPSKTTYLRNKITNFFQEPNETFNEAWERFKGLLRQCPHHGFSELHQLDTFYNSLNSNDQDALDSAAGGNFLDKMPQEGLAIIESKSKVRYSRSRASDSRVSTDAPLSTSSPSNNSFDMQQIAASLEDKMTIKMKQMMNEMKALVVTTPAPVKAVEEGGNPFLGGHALSMFKKESLLYGVNFLLFEEADAFITIDDEPVSPVFPMLHTMIPRVTFSFSQDFSTNDPIISLKIQGDYSPGNFKNILKLLNNRSLPEYAILMNQRYFQILIDPKDQEKTTFTCPYGTFAYRLFGDSFSSCLANLDKMLKRCEDTKLALNWEKSHFMVKEGIVLGHKISRKGIEVDKAKVDIYQRLFQNLSTHDQSLRVEQLLSFLEDCILAFQTLKKKLTEAPILIAPNWDQPFEIMCDASDYAIGAVLGQRIEKHFRPIHYASKTMTEAETNYTTTEKEMLAVVYAFEKFRSYLIMNKSVVYTDHSALKYLFNKKDAKARLFRWILLL